MKRHLSFSVFLLLLFVLRSSGLHCGQHEYPFDDTKCCPHCAPGTEMKTRCTKHTDTRCQACAEGSYNPTFSVWNCQSCTICDPANGLREVKKCERTSNTVCVCLPGYGPATSESDEKRCDPCPKGHFSKGGDERCTPWTNCTAMGRNTFRPGTREDDAVCDNPPTMPHGTALSTKRPSQIEMVHSAPVTTPTSEPTSTSSTSNAPSTGGLPDGVQKPSYLPYILIAAALLLVSGGVILLKAFRRTEKYKEPGRFVDQLETDGKNSFRIPVQEEQTDAKSSLV